MLTASLEFIKQSFFKKYSYAMPSQIAPSCHIVFVSSLLSFPSNSLQRSNAPLLSLVYVQPYPPPRPGTVFDVNFRWTFGGGGGGKRVKQASTSSVARHHVGKLQLNERVLRGISTLPSFKTVRVAPGRGRGIGEGGGKYRLQIDHCLGQHCTANRSCYKTKYDSVQLMVGGTTFQPHTQSSCTRLCVTHTALRGKVIPTWTL